MSQENVDNVRELIAAFNRDDADAFVALCLPDVEWEDAIFWSETFRTYRGREKVREWFAQVREPWESIHIAAEEIIEAGEDRLVVGLGLTARGGGSGVETQAMPGRSTGTRMGQSPGVRSFATATKRSKPPG